MVFSLQCRRGYLWSAALAATTWVAAQPERPLVVVGNSMAPTYASGALLWTVPVDRPLQRGDVVVADTSSGPVVKRVALVAGDRRVQWSTATGWVDMTMLGPPRKASARGRMRFLQVPQGTVFLLGDNLAVSVDSRSFGPVPVGRIRRRVVGAYEPDAAAAVSQPAPRDWIARLTKALGEAELSQCSTP